jgi:tetratricopeptide (TPR) repeat protein
LRATTPAPWPCSSAAFPTWGLGRLELGRLLLKSGERGQLAEFHLDVARALLPENSRAHYLYALALEDQGRPREARRALEVALALRDDYSDAWFRLAGLAFAQGDWAGAVTGYTRLLRYQPGDTGARLQLALALERSGAAKEAEARLRAMLPGPARIQATRRLADLLERVGRLPEAQRLRASVEAARPAKRQLTPSRR